MKQHGKIINSLFKPAWWCANRHSQTLYPTLFRQVVSLDINKQLFELPDGDFLELAWTKQNKSNPIVILLHGLEGSINSSYAKGMLKTIQDASWQGVLMHFRGCGAEHNRKTRSYHSGETEDLDTFVTSLRAQFPDRPIMAIGVSLGGNVLLKYLGTQGSNCLLSAAMAISVPFDLADSSAHLNTGFAKIYQRHLVSLLRRKMLDKFKDNPSQIDMAALNSCTKIYTFDDKITAPIHGFDGADDYYDKSSSKQFLKNIAIPTLILQSKNDPFMTQKAIPTEGELSPSVTLELSEYGGHVGFIYGNTPFKEKYWAEKRLVEFFKQQS